MRYKNRTWRRIHRSAVRLCFNRIILWRHGKIYVLVKDWRDYV